MASEKRTTTRRKAGSNSRSGLSKSAAASPIDLGSTKHGVTYPKFDANQYVATDLLHRKLSLTTFIIPGDDSYTNLSCIEMSDAKKVV